MGVINYRVAFQAHNQLTASALHLISFLLESHFKHGDKVSDASCLSSAVDKIDLFI